MSRYAAIDLTNVPFPQILGPLDFEVILAQLKTDLVQLSPALAPALAVEGDPIHAVLQVFAYRALIHEARYNDIARAAFIATATGADLDNLAAMFGVQRQIIIEADDTVYPPVAAVIESDESLRYRTQLSLEAFSTAGPRGAYEFHAMSAHGDVLSAGVTSPIPGRVQVVLLGQSGAVSPETITTVTDALNAEEIRPLTDEVVVMAADVVSFRVTAVLHMASGPVNQEAHATAIAEVNDYVTRQRRVGATIHRSALFAALHQPGVDWVDLKEPMLDVETTDTQAPWPGEIRITVA